MTDKLNDLLTKKQREELGVELDEKLFDKFIALGQELDDRICDYASGPREFMMLLGMYCCVISKLHSNTPNEAVANFARALPAFDIMAHLLTEKYAPKKLADEEGKHVVN